MTFRSAILRARSRILLAGVLLGSFGAFSGAMAADASAPVLKAPPPVDPGWYFHGGLEAGGRFFIERPGSGFAKSSSVLGWETPPTIDSRAKFEEYGRIPEGLFLDWINLNAGSKDGRYAIDFWGRNVGLNSQGYILDVAELGKHYFTFGFDGTPHLISTSAKSIYGGVGTGRLTVDQTSQDLLTLNSPPGTNVQTQAQRNNIDAYINGPAPINNIELWTQRDKFFTAYRATPTDAWDFKVDYSNEHRTGVRPLGIGFGKGTAANPRPSAGALEVPQPIDDTTQNFGGSGEYVGTTPWGSRFSTKLAYAGSVYQNKIKFMDVDNPFCGGAVGGCSTAGPAPFGPDLLRYALAPDNSAHTFTMNSGVELPFMKSRYMSTVQYTTMRQDDAFIDTAVNGLTYGAGATQIRPYPAASLNGEINSWLSNNVLTTRVTNDLSNTLRVRYYDVKDNTPRITFANYAYADGGVSSTQPLTRNPATYSYDKLNVSDELKWRALKTLTFGGGYFLQRTGFDNFQVTNVASQIDNEVRSLTENKGRVFADFNPTHWVHGKTMYEYAQRRYDGYINSGNVQTNSMRLFMVANRNRHKADTHVEFAALPNVTITPNGGVRWDDYPDGVPNLLGTTKDHSWNAGIEVNTRINPDLRFSVSYNYEEHKLHMAVCCGGAGFGTNIANATWQSDITQRYNTVIAALDWKPIPTKLDIRFEYVLSHALEASAFTPCPAPTSNPDRCNGLTTGVTSAQFPDETAMFQRFNVIARYNVDPETLRSWGWTGEAFVKARYTFERNRVANYAIDTMTPYSPTGEQSDTLTNGGMSLFLAYNNPNYTAQFVALSVGLKW